MAEANTPAASTSAKVDDKPTKGTETNETPRRRRGRTEPPPLELLQETVAHGLAQIIVNMINVEYQRGCCELLEITETGQAKAALLHILQAADAKQQAARDTRAQRKRRRHEDSA